MIPQIIANLDDPKQWGARSDDPLWYNRKRAFCIGTTNPYLERVGIRFRPIVRYVFFWYGDVVIDEHGHRWSSALELCEHLAELHPGHDPEHTGIMTAFQGSPLGRVAA